MLCDMQLVLVKSLWFLMLGLVSNGQVFIYRHYQDQDWCQNLVPKGCPSSHFEYLGLPSHTFYCRRQKCCGSYDVQEFKNQLLIRTSFQKWTHQAKYILTAASIDLQFKTLKLIEQMWWLIYRTVTSSQPFNFS